MSRFRWGVLAAALLSMLLRLRFVFSPINSDEGGYLAIARAWRHGKELYSDVWVDRPQGVLVLYRLWDMIWPEGEDHLRVMSLVLGAVAVIGVGVLVRQVSTPTAGVLAAFFAALLSSAPAMEGYSANGELLAGAFSVLCVAVTACVVTGRLSLRWMAAAGALGAVGFSMKQAGIDGLAASGLWLTVVLVAGLRDRRETAGQLWRLVAGAAAVGAVMVVHGAASDWSGFLYAQYGYRLESRSLFAGPDWTNLSDTWRDLGVIFLPLLYSTLMCAVLVLRRRGSLRLATEKWLLLCWLLMAVVGFSSGGQFLRHYWVTLTFPLAAIAGVAVAAVPPRLRWGLVSVIAAICLWSWADLAFEPSDQVPAAVNNDFRSSKAEHLGDWLRDQMQPGDTMFTMCATAQTYAHAEADPPYPYLWRDGVLRARDSRVKLIALFETDAPTWVVRFDDPVACSGSSELAAMIDARYREAVVIDGVAILRRVD